MATPATMETPSPKSMSLLLMIAVVVGIVAAIGATAFLWLVHELQTLVFSSLPDAMGYASAPWWWAAILLLIGASLVALAQRLPGHTGSGPLTGFHFDNPLQIVPSILLAATASLVFGIALGPCTFAFMAPVLGVTFKVAKTEPVYAASLLLAYGLGHCAVIVAAGTSTELVQRFLDWNEHSKGVTLVKRICGLLVLAAGGYLIWNA